MWDLVIIFVYLLVYQYVSVINFILLKFLISTRNSCSTEIVPHFFSTKQKSGHYIIAKTYIVVKRNTNYDLILPS